MNKLISMNRKLIVSIILAIFFISSYIPSSFGNNIVSQEHLEKTLSDVSTQKEQQLIDTLFNQNNNKYFLDRLDDHSGVTIYDERSDEGYTLISYQFQEADLIDMEGNLIRKWDLVSKPARLLQDGSIIGGDRVYKFPMPFSETYNMTQLDWDGNIVWKFDDWDDSVTGSNMSRQHHDWQREGNPVGYYAPGQEFVLNGKTLILAHINIINETISRKPLWEDVIYEVDWDGNLTGFEWHPSDHFDEMGFDWKAKIGIYLFPGRKDPVFPSGTGDWLHINSISLLGENKWYEEYNDSRFKPDNIIIGSRYSNIIAIIDRETGDIVWKVGPDYTDNTPEGRNIGPIIGHHHAHMIPKGLKGEGNILVFDNGVLGGYGILGTGFQHRDWSRVIEFNPINLSIEWEYTNIVGNSKIERYFNWFFPRSGQDHHFMSWYISSAQRLPNGNTLITEGDNGRIFEVTYDTKEIVWEYVSPTRQHDIYRAYRVPPEWVPGNPAGYPFWEDV